MQVQSVTRQLSCDNQGMDQGLATVIAGVIAVLGAVGGVWVGGRISANATRAAAQAAATANEEARKETRRTAFLDQRRDAVLDFVLAEDADVATCEAIARRARETGELIVAEYDTWTRPWTLLCLVAPDLARYEGSELIEDADAVKVLQLEWARATVQVRGAGLQVPNDPPGLTDAHARFAAARGRFLVAASTHLGVMEYAGQRLLDQAKAERAEAQ